MSAETTKGEPKYTLERFRFYAQVFDTLEQANIPYGIVGGFGTYFWSGKDRQPSWDMDVAVIPQDVGRALEALGNVGLITENKHPDWLNQAWSIGENGEPKYSTDLIHRHSTTLPEGDVQPWWIERGMDAKFLGKERHFAAPEAIAIQKALLWSRRAHDTPDAVQVIHNSNKIRPFDWQLFIREMQADWRLAYSLAVFTEILYGEESKHTLPRSVKEQLHSMFTDHPIPGYARGNYFAYDVATDTEIDAGNEGAWKSGAVALSVEGNENPVQSILNDLIKWYTWGDKGSHLVQAARKIVGQGENFDWNKLIQELGDNWRLALIAMLSTEILFGSKGSELIPSETRRLLSERFVNSDPNEEQGSKLFPDRSWNVA